MFSILLSASSSIQHQGEESISISAGMLSCCSSTCCDGADMYQYHAMYYILLCHTTTCSWHFHDLFHPHHIQKKWCLHPPCFLILHCDILVPAITHHPAQFVLLSNMFLLLPAAAWSSLFFLTSHVANILVLLVLLILMKLRCRCRRSNVCCGTYYPQQSPSAIHTPHTAVVTILVVSRYYHSCHDSATTSSASSTNNIELLRTLWKEVILIVPFLLTTKEEKAFFLVGLLFLFAPGSKQSQ